MTGFAISEFESSRPSQSVRRSAKPHPTVAEMPTNGALLQFGGRSLASQFSELRGYFAKSLRPLPQIFPFSGDGPLRQGSITTAWQAAQFYIRN
jgi:hypothetical protein